MKELQERVAVVTGGASGIGYALAQRFITEGMKVVIADIEEKALDEAVTALGAGGAQVLGVRTDVSLPEDVEALAQATLERFGAVHVVCNNAGVESGAPFLDIPLTTWEWVLKVNFGGVLNGCRTFLPLLKEQGEGHIVNTASTAAFATGLPTFAPYSVSKFAVHALSENLDVELRTAGEPIGVSLLVPGMTKSRMPDAERNRPAGVPLSESPERRRVLDMIRGAMEGNALDPSVTAAQVVDAILHDRFFVLTHPEETIAAQRNRLHAMETGKPPAARKPSGAE
ncbi:MAG TPA: SDR family NAD(P)-dependent oxidoreductase [Streptomyces sp.]|uniref:SDR family NAD(P)-dependent oxidoreductase n=1 Tax=Streptomyces sp. TaxID=1931 RepID=UPI002BBE6A88|nr:SDR family NAD(P)-dependent oxidoreductase [Streptomyces sp.]HWU11536.1 SDR family NAD(P)-dependent oxidoreductase [Streptomyces sp.]